MQFFFRHPLLASYDYYWRVEPSIKLFCDLSYDPFLVMQDEKKVYGFTLSLYEYIETIPTLWEETKSASRCVSDGIDADGQNSSSKTPNISPRTTQ